MKYTLNLASGAYVNRRRLYGAYAALGLVLLGLLIVNVLELTRSLERKREVDARLVELRGRDRAMEKQQEVGAAELAALAKRIDFANELLMRDSYRWTLLLDQLEAHLATGVSIHGLQPDYKTGVLKLTGVADSLIALRHFLDNLTNSQVFTNVYLMQQRTEKGDDAAAGGIVFSIDLQRRSGA